jgi:hypothetical protein
MVLLAASRDGSSEAAEYRKRPVVNLVAGPDTQQLPPDPQSRLYRRPVTKFVPAQFLIFQHAIAPATKNGRSYDFGCIAGLSPRTGGLA